MNKLTIILISILILVSVLACTITTVIPVTVSEESHVTSEQAYKKATLAKPPVPPAVLDAGEKQAEP